MAKKVRIAQAGVAMIHANMFRDTLMLLPETTIEKMDLPDELRLPIVKARAVKSSADFIRVREEVLAVIHHREAELAATGARTPGE